MKFILPVLTLKSMLPVFSFVVFTFGPIHNQAWSLWSWEGVIANLACQLDYIWNQLNLHIYEGFS